MLSRAPARRACLLLALLGGATAVGAQPGRVQQYLDLARATLAEPVTAQEIERALLSPAGVDEVARLFEVSLARSVPLGAERVTPEIGGEATLERGALRFVEYLDPLHEVVRRMVEREGQPAALLAMLAESAEGRHVLQTTGGLHALLYQMTTQPPGDAHRRALRLVMSAAVATHLKTWSVTPETQRAGIERHDWTGRYVGFWHIHPPRPAGDAYGPGLEPSHQDLTVAAEKGQMLTLVFQPGGFDAYDLAAVGAAGTPDLRLARVVRHRSADWERRFRPP